MKIPGNRLKLTLGLSVAVLMLLAVAPVVHGGISWTGIDPVLLANGHVMNVWVEWKTGRECSITGPISVEINARAQLLSESVEVFSCGDLLSRVSTQTTVKEISVPFLFTLKRVYVPASDSFEVRVKVYRDGVLVRTCEGMTNQSFQCEPVDVN